MSAQALRHLELANQIRVARAQLKRDLAERKTSVAQVFASCPPEAERMTIACLLKAQRGWGERRVRKLLAQIHIAESRCVGDLTPQQRERVLSHLAPPPPHGPARRRVPSGPLLEWLEDAGVRLSESDQRAVRHARARGDVSLVVVDGICTRADHPEMGRMLYDEWELVA